MRLVPQIVAGVCVLLGLAGAAYYALCLWAGRRFLLEIKDPTPPDYTPPVSIMKSLKGMDTHMYEAFRSHCLLDYPEYEVLFGVSDLDDPAVAVVERIQREFPQLALRLVHCPERLGANGKVSNLAQMLPSCRYEHVLINDSDIVAPAGYLRRVMPHFRDTRTGMVTTLYRAIAGQTLWSKVEALGISSDFMGGVLVAREMEGGVRFALGATIATTQTVLAGIGGLAALADYLGDDYELGARACAAGYEVALADVVVETTLPGYGWRAFWDHQLRWARNVKDRRTSQYFGLIVTFGLAWAMLGVLVAPKAWWTWSALGMVAIVRLLAAHAIGSRVLHDPQLVRDLWLVPLRDFAALATWIASFFGSTVTWRGQRFRLHDGKLQPAP